MFLFLCFVVCCVLMTVLYYVVSCSCCFCAFLCLCVYLPLALPFSLYYLNIWPHCRKTSGFCFTKNVEKLQSKRLLSLAIFLIDFWHPPIRDLPMGNHSTSFVSFHLGNHPMAWSSKNQIRRNQSGSLFCVFLLIYLFI